MPSNLPDSTLSQGAAPHALSLGTAMERLKHRWGWFVALGVLSIILGLVALGMVVFATIAAVYVVAFCMIIAGGSEVAVGFNSKEWGRFFLWVLAGLFYIAAGAFALAQPVHAAVVLTLVLGAMLLATGVTRIWIGTHMHSHAKTMVIVGGAVTALVGLLVVIGWPSNTLFVLGTLLGIDLLFTGFVWLGFGLRLRNHA